MGGILAGSRLMIPFWGASKQRWVVGAAGGKAFFCLKTNGKKKKIMYSIGQHNYKSDQNL